MVSLVAGLLLSGSLGLAPGFVEPGGWAGVRQVVVAYGGEGDGEQAVLELGSELVARYEERESVLRGRGFEWEVRGSVLFVWSRSIYDSEVESRRASVWRKMSEGVGSVGQFVDLGDVWGAIPGDAEVLRRRGLDPGSVEGVQGELSYERVLWVEGPEGRRIPVTVSPALDPAQYMTGRFAGGESRGATASSGPRTSSSVEFVVIPWRGSGVLEDVERWALVEELASWLAARRRGSAEAQASALAAYGRALASSDPRLADGSLLLSPEDEKAILEQIEGREGWAGNWRVVSSETVPTVNVPVRVGSGRDESLFIVHVRLRNPSPPPNLVRP